MKKLNNIKGISTENVDILREEYGYNELTVEKKESFLMKILHTICEPMFILLLSASIIYFILGEPQDGIVMLVFIVGIISIDIIQEWKTDKTLNALKELSSPTIEVLRDSKKIVISSRDLLPGDIMYIHEGIKIPADGTIIKCSGLMVEEASLTGESIPILKQKEEDNSNDYWKKDYCYASTLVIQGTGTVLVDKIGNETEYGKIGKNVALTTNCETPLQRQTNKLIKICAIVALILCLVVAVITFFNLEDHLLKDRLIESILSGITLAMAMIPEEFPVILTVFLSMGAWRLAKKKSIVKKLPSVETLGAVSVLCVDKTGTITQNKMKVNSIWTNKKEKDVVKIMGLCCAEDTFDPMEKAMLEECSKYSISKEELFNYKRIKEYHFSNKTKIMGTIIEEKGKLTLAVKGSPESIIKYSNMPNDEMKKVKEEIKKISSKGLRVIAIATKKLIKEEIKNQLEDYELELIGLVGLIDPPRKSIKKDIELCNKAGIRVVMITGDNGITASSIAKQVGIKNSSDIITGEMLDNMSEEELRERIKTTNIFSRVIPEHKMKIVKAFKDNGEIVAMTGDGVNDAPALKYADIGIAMGKKGSDVSKEAADLILLDDNFSTIVDTVKDGRRIYDNIKKAVEYIFIIHIPIALSSLIAPFIGISPVCLLLLPIHIVILELVIDPTSSIIFERQPAESNIMERPPRDKKAFLINKKNILKSFIQGIVMFIASFSTYYLVLNNNSNNIGEARSMGLLIIIISNLLLVQVNSSNYDYAFTQIKKLAKDKIMWVANIITFVGIFVALYTPLTTFLKLAPLNIYQLLISICISFISIFWYEIVKYFKRNF